MTDSANFQTQMSEIWKARREREMYRLDLEKEVFMKVQRREKRRDELRTKVKTLHDDLVREDITSSQRVKILLSKVESLKREHQVLAAHTERLKLKKRQIELQLVTSYPIIRQTVQQEAMNSHLPVGISQVGYNVLPQTSQAAGPSQPLQNSLQLQQQQPQQPYNVSQLGGVGDAVYQGIPGIISTVNSRIENMARRGRFDSNTQATQLKNNDKFDTPNTGEDYSTKTTQNYLNTLENRLYSNPVSSNSEYLRQMTNNSAVNQVYNHPIESTSHFSTQDQVLGQQLRHTPRAVQEDTNREGIYNPAYFSNQSDNSNYSSRKNSEQILYSHLENNRELQPQLRSNLEMNSNEELLTARKVNTTKTTENREFINPPYDLEVVESSSEREYINKRDSLYNRDQEYMHDTQSKLLERYPINKENERIRSKSFIEKPSENMHHVSTNQSQSQESNYHQHISENDISNKVQQNHYQYESELNNVSNNDIVYDNYENNYSDGNHYDNYKTEDHNSNQDLQNYIEYRTDSSFNPYNQGEYNQTENKKDFSQESQNIRYQTEENPSNIEYEQDLQDYRENVTDSSLNTYTQGDHVQAENKREFSQESKNIRSQTEENQPNMEYHKSTSESQKCGEYGNHNPDKSHYMKRESVASEKIYEEHNYENTKNEQVDKETLQSNSNNQASTSKDLTRDESLTSTIKKDTPTKQYTEESKNDTSSFNKDSNLSDEDSDFFGSAAPVKSSAAYQNLLGITAPSVGIESDSDDMEGQMAAMALKPKIVTTGPSFKTFASTIPSLKPSAAYLTDTDSVDSVEAAIQASMNKKDNQGAENSERKNSENDAKFSQSPNANSVKVPTAYQSTGATTYPSTTKTKSKAPSALQLNLSDDESYNVSGGGGNESYDDDDDFFD